jgi:hypothetical protein
VVTAQSVRKLLIFSDPEKMRGFHVAKIYLADERASRSAKCQYRSRLCSAIANGGVQRVFFPVIASIGCPPKVLKLRNDMAVGIYCDETWKSGAWAVHWLPADALRFAIIRSNQE